MLILIMMLIAVAAPLVALIASEIKDAKFDRDYRIAMDARAEDMRARKWKNFK